MNVGMLWFDNTPTKTLDDKIAGAARYYSDKYGRVPTICYVHPSMCSAEHKSGNIAVKTHRSVLPNHFWIGAE